MACKGYMVVHMTEEEVGWMLIAGVIGMWLLIRYLVLRRGGNIDE